MGNLCLNLLECIEARCRGPQVSPLANLCWTSEPSVIMRLLAALFVPAALMMQASALMMPLAPRGGAVRLGAPRLAGPPAEDTSSGIQVSLRDPETNRSLRKSKCRS